MDGDATTPAPGVLEGAPSDETPAVTRHGATDVRVAVVSLSARSADGDDARYLEWHLLDHLPEQHRIAGVRNGTRWVSTPGCRAARAAEAAPFDQVDHVVAYLFADPPEAALDTFFALGADLRGAGRMPVRLPAVELGGYRRSTIRASESARIGADVLPWRPARGVYLLLEDGPDAGDDDLLAVTGVIGLWTFDGAADLHARLADTSERRLILIYLEDEPATVAERLAHVLRDRWAQSDVRPILAAPFATVVPFRWGESLPG